MAVAPPLPPTSYPARKVTASSSTATEQREEDERSGAAPVRSKVTPRRIERTDLTPNNIGQVRRLNSVLLPVAYSERFYKDALKDEVRNICKIGLFNDIPVANMICRYEVIPSSSPDKVKVYVMTLGVLAPYRRLGIASNLVSHLLTVASPGTIVSLPDPDAPAPPPAPAKKAADSKADSKDKKKKDSVPKVPTKDYEIECIYLHVQTSNEEARKFYEKHNFKVAQELKEYYRVGVEPRSAWLLESR